MEDRDDNDVDEVWSALTDPRRLAAWFSEVEGDPRLAGEYRARLFASGWVGTERVEAYETPRRLRLTRTSDQASVPVIGVEVTLDVDGDHMTAVASRCGGCPWSSSPRTGRGGRSVSRISPPIWPGAGVATPRRDGTSPPPPMRGWRPPSARPGGPPPGVGVGRPSSSDSAVTALAVLFCSPAATSGPGDVASLRLHALGAVRSWTVTCRVSGDNVTVPVLWSIRPADVVATLSTKHGSSKSTFPDGR